MSPACIRHFKVNARIRSSEYMEHGMENPLVREIRDLNLRNHGKSSLGASESASTGPEPVEIAPTEELRNLLLIQVRRRVNRVIERFGHEIKALAPATAVEPKPQRLGMEETQRIGVHAADRSPVTIELGATNPGESSTATSGFEAALHRLAERVQHFQDHLDAARSAERIQTHTFLERNLEELSSDMTRNFSDAMRDLLAGLEERLAPPAQALPGAAQESDSSWRSELATRAQALEVKFDELRDWLAKQAAEAAVPEEHAARVDPTIDLTDRLARLERTIAEKLESVSKSGSDQAQECRELRASLRSMLDDVHAKLDSLEVASASPPNAGATASNTAGLAAAATAPGTGGGDPADLVRSVRKDISLLVLTLNNHLEETARIRAELSEIKSLVLTTGAKSAPGSGADALQVTLGKALEGIETLKKLPEQVAALLAAADETHQSTLSAAIQESAEIIVSRVEECVRNER